MVDLQPEMLVRGSTRTRGHSNVVFTAADATSLPFGGSSFDVAFLAMMLGEVPDPGACLREVHRVLVPHGSLIVGETVRDSDFIRMKELLALARDAGFGCHAIRGSRWQYLARFQRSS